MVGKRFAKNDFRLDIMQYTLGTTRRAAFHAQTQVGNNWFKELDIKVNSCCALTGTITGEADQDTKDKGTMVPSEFFDVGSSSGEGTAKKTTAIRKGKSGPSKNATKPAEQDASNSLTC